MTVDVIIPIYKPGKDFQKLVDKLNEQTLVPGKIIIMHSVDRGDTLDEFSLPENAEVHEIPRESFDHGHTRNLGVNYSKAQAFICMTQDAIPCDENLVELLTSALDESVRMCYARQVARKNASEIERITRKFNYPDKSVIKNQGDLDRLGIKTYFASNVCCAYDRKTFDKLGGFIDKTDFNEDMMYASKLVKAGYSIKYCAAAAVFHSHDCTIKQQFARNFDLGVSQVKHPEYFGDVKSESEGMKLVSETAKELFKKGKPYLIPKLVFTSGVKYIGYKAGRISGAKDSV